MGKVVHDDTRGALERSDQMTPEQLLLIDAILTLPETSPERGVATEDRGDPRCDGVLRRGGGEVSPPCSANQIRITAFEKGHMKMRARRSTD